MSLGAIGTFVGTAQAGPLALCGNQTLSVPPSIDHVVVVFLENLSYRSVVGSTNAPYQTALASRCGNATAKFGATHTSAANYLATSAGEYPAGSAPGCGSVGGCRDGSDNVYQQLDRAGKSWRSYQESMPAPCTTSSGGNYKIGHNPPLFYSSISSAECSADDLPVADLTAASGALWQDLQNQSLPSLSWVTPNLDNDGEGGGGAAAAERAADTWLQGFTDLVGESPSYQAGTLLLVSYDEGTGPDRATGEDCTNQSLDMPVMNGVSAHRDSCHVAMFVVFPYTSAGGSDGTFFDHYSITKTIEDLFGLPHLAHAGDTQTNSLVGHVGIGLPVAAPSPTQTTTPTHACPGTPIGLRELSQNVSVETAQTGWTGMYNGQSSLSRAQPPGGSYDGNWGLRIAPKAGASGVAGVNNAGPAWVPASPGTVAGATYSGSAFVATSVPGEKVSLAVREITSAGKAVGYHTATVTSIDNAWQQLVSTYTAKYSGDLLRVSLFASNFASSAQNLTAGCLSLQTSAQ